MTASKRCPRCGLVKAAEAFYRRRRGQQLSSYCQPCTRAASREGRRRRRQDPATAVQLRVVDRARQRRHGTWAPGVEAAGADLAHLDLQGPHDLRHTFATWLEDAAIPSRVIVSLWATPAVADLEAAMVARWVASTERRPRQWWPVLLGQ